MLDMKNNTNRHFTVNFQAVRSALQISICLLGITGRNNVFPYFVNSTETWTCLNPSRFRPAETWWSSFPWTGRVSVMFPSRKWTIMFPTTCPIGHCCVCSPRLFASEIFCDLPTYNKQRMNKMSPSRCTCCLETQNARWRHVMACC